MKKILTLLFLGVLPCLVFSQSSNTPNITDDSEMLRQIFDEALTNGSCYENLRSLCKDIGPRLSGSDGADKAVKWGEKVLQEIADTVWLQPVMVPHWVRGEKEVAEIRMPNGEKIPVDICA